MHIEDLCRCASDVSERYDPSIAAGFYSQLCAVMAGFAFAGLVLVATLRFGDGRGNNVSGPSTGTVLALLGAMVGLTVCSLSYAVSAADPAAESGYVAHVAAAVSFTASAYALMVALHLLFVDCGLPTVITRSSRVMTVAVLTLANAHVLGGVHEIAVAAGSDALRGIAIGGCGVVGTGVIVAALYHIRYEGSIDGSDGKPFVKLLISVAVLSLVLSVLGSIIAGSAPEGTAAVSGYSALLVVWAISMFGERLSVRLVVSRRSLSAQ